MALYVHNMATPGVNAKHDCVAWSEGSHTTKRKAWRMRVGVIPPSYEVSLAALTKQLHAWQSRMDKARQSTGIGAAEYRNALRAALSVSSDIDELTWAHCRAELVAKRATP
jgi:hypothetical protein